MSIILKSSTIFPENEYSQEYFLDMLSSFWPSKSQEIAKFAQSVCVENRALAIDIKEVLKLGSFSMRNQLWQEKAHELCAKSIVKVLDGLGLKIEDINQFITTSVTGIAIPSLDTMLMNSLNFNPNTKRMPLFGFGCLGGVAALNRAHEYLVANPKDVVLVSAAELCSLTFQMKDLSIENLIGSSLFGDGAASVILVGKEHALAGKGEYEILDYGAYFYKDTSSTMGWDIQDTGFKLVLNKNVSSIVEDNIPKNISQLLDRNRLAKDDIKFSISHPGGPKVLESMQKSLMMDKSAFKYSWDSLKEHGNMSSVSVLNVLEKSIDNKLGKAEEIGVMAAMGPGFNSEINLIKKL